MYPHDLYSIDFFGLGAVLVTDLLKLGAGRDDACGVDEVLDHDAWSRKWQREEASAAVTNQHVTHLLKTRTLKLIGRVILSEFDSTAINMDDSF